MMSCCMLWCTLLYRDVLLNGKVHCGKYHDVLLYALVHYDVPWCLIVACYGTLWCTMVYFCLLYCTVYVQHFNI